MPRALVYHEHGKADQVLRLEDVSVAAPGRGEVGIALRAAVIHPSDLGMIGGSYGKLKTLPAVAGREGVGEVTSLGPGVNQDWLGARVRMPVETGAWVEAVNTSVENLVRLPDDLDWPLLAQAHVNPPTAWRLLHDFADLKPGDWLVQNAGNSAVGFAVAGLARHLKLNCLCLVRDARWEQPLLEAGATRVLAEDTEWFRTVDDLTGGKAIRLGLNSVGGESALALIRALGEGGTLVTFGGMRGDKIRFPTRELIFHDIALRGFWMDRWFRQSSRQAADAMMAHIFDCLRQGIITQPVEAGYPFNHAMQAVAHAMQPGRRGKILILGDR